MLKEKQICSFGKAFLSKKRFRVESRGSLFAIYYWNDYKRLFLFKDLFLSNTIIFIYPALKTEGFISNLDFKDSRCYVRGWKGGEGVKRERDRRREKEDARRLTPDP